MRKPKAKRQRPSKAVPGRSLYGRLPGFDVSKGEARRLAILEAAISVLATHGIHALSLEEVGRRAKMRRSHVAYYFTNPELLLDAVIRHVVAVGQQITVARLAEVSGARERLLAHARATFEWFESNPDHASVMLLMQYYASVRPDYRELNRIVRQAGEDRIRAILEAGPLSPKASAADIRRAAVSIRGHLVGSLLVYFTASGKVTMKEDLIATQSAIEALAREVWQS